MITKNISNLVQCHLLTLSNSFVIFSTWVLWIMYESPPQKCPPQKYPPQKYPPWKCSPRKYPPRKYILNLWRRSRRWSGQIVIFSTWVLKNKLSKSSAEIYSTEISSKEISSTEISSSEISSMEISSMVSGGGQVENMHRLTL